MRKLRITIDVPIVDLPDDERVELHEQMMLDPDETLENLKDYMSMVDGADRIASAIANAIDLADRSEMFSGSEVFVTLPEFNYLDPSTEAQVLSAQWVPE